MEHLKFTEKVVLAEGEWNGISFSAILIKKMVNEFKKLDEAEQDRILSIYADHWETIDSWIGKASNLKWDEKSKSAIADLEFIDEDVITKLQFQIEEQKEPSWGISPSLNLQRDNTGKLIHVTLRNLSLVIDAAQGDKAKLEAQAKGGKEPMLDTKIEELKTQSEKDQQKAIETFLSEANGVVQNAKEKMAEDKEGDTEDQSKNLAIELADLLKKADEIAKLAKGELVERMAGFVTEVKWLESMLKKSIDNKKDEDADNKSQLEKLPILRLRFEEGDKFDSLGNKSYRKELIRVGSYLDPRDLSSNLEVTKERIETWIKNFDANLKRVPIPIRHTDNPMRNTGWLESLELEGDSLFGVIGFTNAEAQKLVDEGSIKDVSISLDPNFLDTKTKKTHGETIDHVALTMMPFISQLDAFEPISAESQRRVIEMERAETKPEGGQDVVLKALTGSNSELQKRLLVLEKERDESTKNKIETEVNELVSSGRLTPGLKDRVFNLALSSRNQLIKLEKGKEVDLGSELLSILKGMEITFEMVQKTQQDSTRPTGKKYLKPEEFGGDYQKNVNDGKIGFEAVSGKAYWKE